MIEIIAYSAMTRPYYFLRFKELYAWFIVDYLTPAFIFNDFFN